MRKSTHILVFFILQLFTFYGYTQTFQPRIPQLEKAFLLNPLDYHQYESLSFLVSEHYTQLTVSERKKIRDFLSAHAHFSGIHIPPPKEAGQPITIKGTVKDTKGTPLKNIKLFVFHADAKGYYAPTDAASKRMNEPDARLFGYVITDKEGKYSFETIHPGTYPNKYEGRYIPQHIHIQVQQVKYKDYSIQMTFEDDPSMKDPYWQKWARDLTYPVIRLTAIAHEKTGIHNITLPER
jgi:hypothetical protein